LPLLEAKPPGGVRVVRVLLEARGASPCGGRVPNLRAGWGPTARLPSLSAVADRPGITTQAPDAHHWLRFQPGCRAAAVLRGGRCPNSMDRVL